MDAEKRAPVQIDKNAVTALRRAVKQRRLTRAQHAQLRALMERLEEVEPTENGAERAVRYNLRVIDTQIRDVLARVEGDVFDAKALNAMPKYMRSRILQRLDNVAHRLTRDSMQARLRGYSTHTFQCMKDFENCRARAARAQGNQRHWCALALLVCLAARMGRIFSKQQ